MKKRKFLMIATIALPLFVAATQIRAYLDFRYSVAPRTAHAFVCSMVSVKDSPAIEALSEKYSAAETRYLLERLRGDKDLYRDVCTAPPNTYIHSLDCVGVTVHPLHGGQMFLLYRFRSAEQRYRLWHVLVWHIPGWNDPGVSKF